MFGGSIGGPVRKDKIFFFGDYQGVRQKTGSAVKTTVPTALAHNTCTSGGSCDLSDYLNPALGGSPQYQVFDPTTGVTPDSPAGRTPFTGNIIPAGDLSAPSINLMKDMPLPNTGNGSIVNNYVASGSGIFNNNQFDVRGDMPDEPEVSFVWPLHSVQLLAFWGSVLWSGGWTRVWRRWFRRN